MNSENILNKDANQKTHGLGIPTAVFIEDVDYFMTKEENKNAKSVLTRLDEQYGKYKFMEMNLHRKKKILMKQIPDIITSLEMLKLLTLKKEKNEATETHFSVCDDIYVKAKVPPTDKVGLWLGANIMLEYELDEAEDFLKNNLIAADKALSQIEDELDFLREQLTTTEVNMARVYNWDVKQGGGKDDL